MDVSYKINPEMKDTLTGAVLEYQVLSRHLEERKQKVGLLCQESMKQLGVDPTKYLMDINPLSGQWDLRMINEPVGEVKSISGNGHSLDEVKETVVAN